MNSSLPSIPLDLYLTTQTLDSSNAVVRATPSTPTIAAVVCSVQPMSAYERDTWGRRNIIGEWKIYTNYNFDASAPGSPKLGWRLKDPATGFIYEVQGVERSASGRLRLNILYKLICRRVIAKNTGV